MKYLVPGVEYIRTGPTRDGDYSYTNMIVVFRDYCVNGELIVDIPASDFNIEIKNYRLPKSFNDGKWTSSWSIKNGLKTSLDKYKGKHIKRRKPTEYDDESIVNYAVELVSATKYHVVIKNNLGKESILDSRYTNPNDWEVVDI